MNVVIVVYMFELKYLACEYECLEHLVQSIDQVINFIEEFKN